MEVISVFGAMPLALCEKVFLSGRDCIKRMTIEMLVAVLAIPVEVIFGTIGPYCTAMVFMTNVICLFYTYYVFHREKPRSKFFTIYMLSSVLYMILVFEYSVPLFELLPEENLILVLLVLATIYFLCMVQKNAPGNVALSGVMQKNELAATAAHGDTTTALLLDNIELSSHDGSDGNALAYHCTICQVSIMEWDHHNFWLNCCIGKRNHRFYFLALIGAELALLLGSYLTLTAICHPVLVARIWSVSILAPDDCLEVYELVEMAIPFIMSTYALLMAACVLLAIVKQCVNISRRSPNSAISRQSFSKFKTILQNWRRFMQ